MKTLNTVIFDNGFPKPTLGDLLKMNKNSVHGLDYALTHNVEAKSEYGEVILELIHLLLNRIHDNMTDAETVADIINSIADTIREKKPKRIVKCSIERLIDFLTITKQIFPDVSNKELFEMLCDNGMINKQSICGVNNVLKHSIESKSEYGDVTLDLIKLLLNHISDNIT